MPGNPTPTPATARAVPTRRLDFEAVLADLDRHFAGDQNLIVSHMGATLSAVFPDGEDFFVRSVRAVRDQIDDPELSRQIAGFIGQESMHGRQHRLLNHRLAELGYPTERIAAMTRKDLAKAEAESSVLENLATTAALEHFTATLAELLLRDERSRQAIGTSAATDLLLWHAVEECEHKAVAFDVYRAVGGDDELRVKTMNRVMLRFTVGIGGETIRSLFGDRTAYRGLRLPRDLVAFLRSPLFHSGLWSRLRDYNRPDFHPDDHDTDALLAEWRDALFGDEGSLVDQLVASA